MDNIYFSDDLENCFAALEAAIMRYDDGEFRDGVLFGLNLVRLSLGLPSLALLEAWRSGSPLPLRSGFRYP